MTEDMIWTNSGDFHAMEPRDLYTENMPPAYADRMPKTEI
jgi:hypothetical protein